jgi:hypothetical protein
MLDARDGGTKHTIAHNAQGLQKRLSKLQAVLRSLLCSCWFLCSSSESESKKEAMRCLKRYITRETYRARSLG